MLTLQTWALDKTTATTLLPHTKRLARPRMLKKAITCRFHRHLLSTQRVTQEVLLPCSRIHEMVQQHGFPSSSLTWLMQHDFSYVHGIIVGTQKDYVRPSTSTCRSHQTPDSEHHCHTFPIICAYGTRELISSAQQVLLECIKVHVTVNPPAPTGPPGCGDLLAIPIGL